MDASERMLRLLESAASHTWFRYVPDKIFSVNYSKIGLGNLKDKNAPARIDGEKRVYSEASIIDNGKGLSYVVAWQNYTNQGMELIARIIEKTIGLIT